MRLYCCVLALVVASCANASVNSNQNKSDVAVFEISLEHPQVHQKINPDDDGDPLTARFVQVEVVHVKNPQNRPVEFQVHYQPADGEQILLGAFSLYPPNNPGKFIVPTQGKVKRDGMLILTLVRSAQVVAGDVIEMTVRPMKFVK
jgi:hypothetical protein